MFLQKKFCVVIQNFLKDLYQSISSKVFFPSVAVCKDEHAMDTSWENNGCQCFLCIFIYLFIS